MVRIDRKAIPFLLIAALSAALFIAFTQMAAADSNLGEETAPTSAVAPSSPQSAPLSTPVSGLIDVNTTWTLANSPYVVTGDVLIADTATLTIEVGVEVRFQANTMMQVDGGLVAHAFEQGGFDWETLLDELVSRRFGDTPAADSAELARRARFLSGRGFPGDLVGRRLGRMRHP